MSLFHTGGGRKGGEGGEGNEVGREGGKIGREGEEEGRGGREGGKEGGRNKTNEKFYTILAEAIMILLTKYPSCFKPPFQ